MSEPAKLEWDDPVMMAHAWGTAILEESQRRLFEESFPRLQTCLNLLEEDEIWQRPRAEMPSVGNLVLHLCGNTRQWIGSGLGGLPDERDRDREFDADGGLTRAELIALLEDTAERLWGAMMRVEATSLLNKRQVQGFDTTGVGILMHVVEHFSYHVGQVSWYVKELKGVDLGYYAGVDLTRKSQPSE